MNKAVWSSILVAAMLLAVAGMADAQQQEKIRRIGFLSGASLNTGRVQAFGQGLPDLGYFEGKNIAIEYRLAEGKAERLPALAAELLRLQVAIIVTSSTAAVKTAKQATTEIPIVVASAGDLVGEGIVASLARPGGNITGLTAIAPDLSGKRLAILKESIPKATRFAVMWHRNPNDEKEVKETEVAAQAMHLQLQSLPVQSPDEFQNAYAAMRKERAEALISSRGLFSAFAEKNCLN
jgi:putative ABC transport system substrate-binding protein